MVSPVNSMAVGKASGRTLHLLRLEGMGREASLALVLRKELGLVFTALGFFLQHVIILCLFTPVYFQGLLYTDLLSMSYRGERG